MIYQAFGFWGIALLMRVLEEGYEEVSLPQPLYTYAFFFLPSIHYWTGAIGKDSLFFLGVSACLWGSMQFWKRLPVLAGGLFLMLAIRPHIAVVAMVALTLSVLSDRSTRFPVRVAMFAAAIVGTIVAVATVRSTFRIDLTSLDAYSDALAGREALLQMDVNVVGRTTVDLPFPLRVLSLLFRPFFLDANDILGFVVSLENLILVVLVAVFVIKWRVMKALVKSVPYVRFAFFSSVGTLLVLSIGYFNVGLGIRQKATMILPGLLVMAMALSAVLASRRRQYMTLRLVGAPAERLSHPA
jgi:hypothetical protein